MTAAHADIDAIAEALRPIILRLSRQLRREANVVGVSPLDVTLINAIRKAPGVGVSELADREQMSRPTMSAHVKRLEAAGLIARLPPDEADRRRVALTVTPAGQAAFEAVRKRRTGWLVERLEALSAKDRAVLEAALEALDQLAGERT